MTPGTPASPVRDPGRWPLATVWGRLCAARDEYSVALETDDERAEAALDAEMARLESELSEGPVLSAADAVSVLRFAQLLSGHQGDQTITLSIEKVIGWMVGHMAGGTLG